MIPFGEPPLPVERILNNARPASERRTQPSIIGAATAGRSVHRSQPVDCNEARSVAVIGFMPAATAKKGPVDIAAAIIQPSQ